MAKTTEPELTEEEKNVRMWKIKQLIKQLESAKGNGTSMISLIIPKGKAISQAAKMLAEEAGTATNIKSRVNRLSVLEAITSTQQRLKLYNKTPPNGLVVYCGTVMTDDGKTKKKTIDFEPFKPINVSLYLCDNKFHTAPLSELLESNDKFGFVVMDGHGCLFGTLCGNSRSVLHKFSVMLPKKHGRGGQSAVRFARLRQEKRHNYLRKCAETSTQLFIADDKPNITGLILAGSADFKTELAQSDLFDQRLRAVVIKIVDVPYGSEQGFNKAIDLSQDSLKNVKFIREKKVIDAFFDNINRDTGKFVFGIVETLRAMEMGAVETLIVWENLSASRYTFKNSDGEEIVKVLTEDQVKDPKNFHDDQGVKLDIQKEEPFLEYLATHYKEIGCKIEFVTDRSSEGSQFVKGFGGIGGLLRYVVDMDTVNMYLDESQYGGDDDDFDDLSDFI